LEDRKLDIADKQAETAHMKAMADVVAAGMAIASDGTVFALPPPEDDPEDKGGEDKGENAPRGTSEMPDLTPTLSALAQGQAAIAEALAAMSAPKRIVRDETGRAVGVVPVQAPSGEGVSDAD
jgi:hypothetical protein